MTYNNLIDSILEEDISRPERVNALKELGNPMAKVTLNLNKQMIRKFEEQLNDTDAEVRITFAQWFEDEFNNNGDVLLEMLLGDY